MKVASGVYSSLVRRAALLLATLLAMPAAFAADGLDDFRILYFERLSLSPATAQPDSQQKATDDPLLAGIQFDAYGRRFELALEPNTRIMQEPGTTRVAYLGSVSQQPGSWARLTRVGDALYGLIWDGAELYVVEPVAEARAFMVSPPSQAQEGNVIYRLSDTLVDLGTGFCSAIDTAPDESPSTGLAAFKALTADLKAQLLLQQAAGATLRLTLSALGDALFLQRYATDAAARDAILVRLNNVDGIFSAQLGVGIQISSVSLYDSSTDPFTPVTIAGNLLDELRNLRGNSPTLNANGLTHLFTGRNLDGTTVGSAYIGTLCQRSYGVGLTESRGRGATIESLIAAHEIGHNFGAVHDGDPAGECAATPANQFIMAPQATSDIDSFSQCSLNMMSRSLAQAACISALPPPNASVAFAPSPAGLTIGQSFPWSVIVTNTGGQQTPAATVDVALPSSIAAENATVAGGSCTSTAGAVQCSLGPLDAGESRSVSLTLRAQATGVFMVRAVATAVNDANLSNNTATASLAIDAAASAPSTDPISPKGGGGGGGSMELFTLLGLALLARPRQRRQPVS